MILSASDVLVQHRATLAERLDQLRHQLALIGAEADELVTGIEQCDIGLAAIVSAATTPAPLQLPAPTPAEKPSPLEGEGAEHREAGEGSISKSDVVVDDVLSVEYPPQVAAPQPEPLSRTAGQGADPERAPGEGKARVARGKNLVPNKSALINAIVRLTPPIAMADFEAIAAEFGITVKQAAKFHNNNRMEIKARRAKLAAPPESTPLPPPASAQGSVQAETPAPDQGRGGQDKPFRGPTPPRQQTRQ